MSCAGIIPTKLKCLVTMLMVVRGGELSEIYLYKDLGVSKVLGSGSGLSSIILGI